MSRSRVCALCLFLGACTPLPPPSVEIGVRLDDLGLAKEPVLEGVGLGGISDIALGDYSPEDGLEIVTAGTEGAIIADQAFRIFSMVSFGGNEPARAFEVIDLELDGTAEYVYVNRAPGGLFVLDGTGERLWAVDISLTPEFADYGDVDGDGLLEFLYLGNECGTLLDHEGNTVVEICPAERTFNSAALSDVDLDGRKEILIYRNFDCCSDRGFPLPPGERAAYDSAGNLLSTEPCTCSEAFAGRSRFPANSGEKHFVDCGSDEGPFPLDDLENGIYDAVGNFVFGFDPPQATYESCERLNVRTVRLNPNAEPYVAMSRAFSYTGSVGTETIHRTRLTIYDSAGVLVYHEVLRESKAGLTAIPSDIEESEDLLIGAGDIVYRYRYKQELRGDDDS